MSCPICGSSICIKSFHSLEEQELFDERELMPENINVLREMLQEARNEILDLKKQINDMDII